VADGSRMVPELYAGETLMGMNRERHSQNLSSRRLGGKNNRRGRRKGNKDDEKEAEY